jgi:hypothetical protein
VSTLNHASTWFSQDAEDAPLDLPQPQQQHPRGVIERQTRLLVIAR